MNNNVFPMGCLPASIQCVINDVGNKTKAPLPLISATVLAAVATAAQGTYRVRRWEGLTSNISIYVLTIAESGERKTSVDSLVFESLRSMQAKGEDDYEGLMFDYESAKKVWDIKERVLERAIIKALEKGKSVVGLEGELRAHAKAKPAKPVKSKLIYKDVTPERLLEGLCESSKAATLIEDEGGRFLNGYVMRSPGDICSLWNGGTIDIERKNAPSYILRDPRFSACIQIQPGILEKFLLKKGDVARSSGLLARFLISWPISNIGLRTGLSGHSNDGALEQFGQRLLELSSRRDDVVLVFSEDAQVQWKNYSDSIELRMLAGCLLSNAKDFGSKVAENTARIAALMHLIDSDAEEISGETLASAIYLMDWYVSEFLRVFGLVGGVSEIEKDALDVENFIREVAFKYPYGWVPQKIILQYGPNRLRKKAALEPVLQYLLNQRRICYFPSGRSMMVCIAS